LVWRCFAHGKDEYKRRLEREVPTCHRILAVLDYLLLGAR
jgi:hypothetical protein